MYYIVTSCLFQLLIDFSRQYFLNQQLKSLISPYRIHSNKLLPTINYFDTNSANSWARMKKQIRNYGYQFQQRNILLLNALFIYLGLVYLLTWLSNLGYMKFAKGLDTDLSKFLD